MCIIFGISCHESNHDTRLADAPIKMTLSYSSLARQRNSEGFNSGDLRSVNSLPGY